MFQVTSVFIWGQEFFSILISMSSPLQGILKMNWFLIPTCDAHFGLKSNLEIVMRQEKLKPHALGGIIKLSAAGSNQVRTPTKIDRNPACGVLALISEL